MIMPGTGIIGMIGIESGTGLRPLCAALGSDMVCSGRYRNGIDQYMINGARRSNKLYLKCCVLVECSPHIQEQRSINGACISNK